MILLTGFEAFGDDPSDQGLNPSAALAQNFHQQMIANMPVHGEVLPCEYDRAFTVLRKHLKTLRPDWVVCLGQAGGRSSLSIERIAINLDDAVLPDNAGILRSAQAIVRNGAAAYFSTLPIYAMQTAVHINGQACELSSSAGQFVCNHVFYRLMRELKKEQSRHMRGGFIHVPYLPEQALSGQASMTLEEMKQALRVALRAMLAS